MKQIVLLVITVINVCATSLLAAPTRALMASEIEAVAADVTVLIDGINPGSGVIIARDRSRYLVLTARHVVATEDEYWIVTPDGENYLLDYSTVQPIPGVDLAVLEFQSDRPYAIASLAVYPYDQGFPYVFVAGWSGSFIQAVPLEQQFSGGLLLRQTYGLVQAQAPLSEGYEMFYTSITALGMSGGPVLDTDGRVIGIHGRSEGEEFRYADTQEQGRLMLGFSAGIPIQTFLRSLSQVNFPPTWAIQLERPAPLTDAERQSIQTSLEPPPLTDRNDPVAWTNRGNQLYRLERFSEAVAAFEQAVRLQPDFYQAWYGLGQVRMTTERYTDALSAFTQAFQINPSFAHALRERSLVYLLLDQPQAAARDLDQVVQLTPEDYVAWYLRGNVFRRHLGWTEAALGAYDRAIELAPHFTLARIERGRTLYEGGRYSEALQAFRQTTQADSHSALAWYWQGQVLLELGQASEALVAVDQAILRDDTSAAHWLLRAKIFMALGQIQNAQAALSETLALDADHREAQSLLESLRNTN